MRGRGEGEERRGEIEVERRYGEREEERRHIKESVYKFIMIFYLQNKFLKNTIFLTDRI